MKGKPLYAAMAAVLLLTAFLPVSLARALPDEAIVAGIESIITRNMEKYHIPGAVMSVVKDGRVLAARGYGFSDVEGQVAPDPEGTAFRIASVSKLFTANAVLQLVEQGKLDLDADVNQYLKGFQVPEAFGKPVTLRNILTHTSGFDEPADFGFVFYDLGKQIPLSEIIRRSMPARIRAPGEVTQYNNYAVSLAGLIVENVSGLPFEEYVQKNIFEPLGMENSSFVLDDAVLGRLAKGHVLSGGELKLIPYVQIGVRPSGSMSSTAADMARFMLSQMNGGGETPILKPETLKEIETQQFRDYEGFEGYGFGYFCTAAGGLEHMGALNSFNAYLLLVPEENTGVFWATNLGSEDFLTHVSYSIKDFLMERSSANFLVAEEGAQVNRAYEGEYIAIRAALGSVSKILRLLPGGALPLPARDLGGQLRVGTVTYRPVRADVYQSLDKSHYLLFRTDSAGRAVMMTNNVLGFVRVPWYEAAPVNTALLACFLLLFLVLFIARLTRRARRKVELQGVAGGLATAALGVNALAVIFVCVAACNLIDAYGSIIPYYILLALTNLSVSCTLWVVGYYLLKAARGKVVVRLGAAVFLAAGGAYLLFLWNWNLIGWKVF